MPSSDVSRTTLTDAEHVFQRRPQRPVTYELKTQLDGSCVIERVERTHFGGAFATREDARKYMVATADERKARDAQQ